MGSYNLVGAFSSDTTISTPVAINKGGTGQTTAQAALDALTNVSAASANEVLTKDGSGNATFQSASGGGKYTLIERKEVSSGTSIDIEFTSESGANISSLICYYDIQRTNVATCDVLLQYGSGGSLVTSGYYTQQVEVSDSANTAYSNQSEWLLARNPNYRHCAGMVQIYVSDPSMTTANADMLMTGSSTDPNPEGYLVAGARDGTENSIDQVKLSIDAGALEAGSVLTLYSVDST